MKKIRIGIFGVGPRGEDLAKNFMMLNCEIAAICDNRKEQLKKISEKLGKDIPAFDSFDEFIKTDMDAVVLANHIEKGSTITVVKRLLSYVNHGVKFRILNCRMTVCIIYSASTLGTEI